MFYIHKRRIAGGRQTTYNHHVQTPFVATVVFGRPDRDRTLVSVSSAAATDGADDWQEVLAFAERGRDRAHVGYFFDVAVEVGVVGRTLLAVGFAKYAPEPRKLHRGG